VKTAFFIVLVVAVVAAARPSTAFQHRYSKQHQHQQQNAYHHNCGTNNNNKNDYQNCETRHRPFGKHGGAIRQYWQGDCGCTQQLKRGSMSSTRLRGGGSPDEGALATDKAASKRDKFRRRGMAVALGLSNFSVMGAKCALPSVLSLLMSPDRGMTFLTPTSKPFSSVLSAKYQFAQLLGFSTLSIALGKMLLGPVIDKMGGIRALQATLLLLLSLLATITMTQRFWIFAACWVLVDFVFSSCWAACISSIQQSFPSSEWGEQIGYLATGARLGNAFSFSLFAAILFALEDRMAQPWRVIFLVSTAIQIAPLCLLSYFGGMTIDANKSAAAAAAKIDNNNNNDDNTNKKASVTPAKDAPRFRDSLAILQREATTPEFWLHLVSRSCLMVFASFLLFVPTLMNQVYGCSNAVAAQVASAYSLGCLLSVSLGSRLYAALPTTKQQIGMMTSLLALATVASLSQLGHATGIAPLSWTLATLSMFVWGFAFSLPFYLPPSLYALARGGRQCSASIADSFDFFGFALLAWFNKYVASIGQHSNPSSWVGCFKLTTACALVAMVAQSFAIGLEKKKASPPTVA
jgi:sugar phosphate permease